MAAAYRFSLEVPLSMMMDRFIGSRLISEIVSPDMMAAKRTKKAHIPTYIQNSAPQPTSEVRASGPRTQCDHGHGMLGASSPGVVKFDMSYRKSSLLLSINFSFQPAQQ